MRVLIAGAGIGGLTTALCLLKSKHQVLLFEQASEFSAIGAGIQLGANALHVMDYLGLLSKIESLAVDPQAIEFRDYQSGESLYNIELGARYAAQYGAPYLHIHRADLHTILIDELNRCAPYSLILGANITSYSQSDSSATIIVDGRTHTGDCLIGADGIKSQIRAQLLGHHSPKFTGNVAWRAVVDAQALPNNWMDKVTTNFIGPKKHMVMYYLRKQQLVNMVGVVENHRWTNDSWVAKSPRQELLSDFAGWHPMVEQLVNAVDKDQCYRWALYDHRPFPNWSTGRITLLGDAAHATLPFLAAGAAAAIEDARVLQRALDQVDEVSVALQLYQRNRMARTAKIQNTSAHLAKLYHIEKAWARKAAFKALKIIPSKKEAFLPEYDANTVPLL